MFILESMKILFLLGTFLVPLHLCTVIKKASFLPRGGCCNPHYGSFSGSSYNEKMRVTKQNHTQTPTTLLYDKLILMKCIWGYHLTRGKCMSLIVTGWVTLMQHCPVSRSNSEAFFCLSCNDNNDRCLLWCCNFQNRSLRMYQFAAGIIITIRSLHPEVLPIYSAHQISES